MANNSEWCRLDADTFRCPDGRVLRWDDLPDGLRLGEDRDVAIARAIGCSSPSVRNERLRRGIPLRTTHHSHTLGRYTDAELRRQNFASAMRRNFEIELQRRGYGDSGGEALRSSAGWMGDTPAEVIPDYRNIDGSPRRRSPTGRTKTPPPTA